VVRDDAELNLRVVGKTRYRKDLGAEKNGHLP